MTKTPKKPEPLDVTEDRPTGDEVQTQPEAGIADDRLSGGIIGSVITDEIGLSAEDARLLYSGIDTGFIQSQPMNLSLSQNGEAIVTFHPDGAIEVGEKYTAGEAAAAFWDAFKDLARQAWLDHVAVKDDPILSQEMELPQEQDEREPDLPVAKMRAKLRISGVFPTQAGDMEVMRFHGVAKSDGPYPEDGSDENNTYAKFSPSVDLQLLLANPNLVGTFAVGDTFYVDFIPAPK